MKFPLLLTATATLLILALSAPTTISTPCHTSTPTRTSTPCHTSTPTRTSTPCHTSTPTTTSTSTTASIPTTTSTSTTSSTSTTTSTPSPTSTPSVLIQLDYTEEGIALGTVPLTNILTPIRGHFSTTFAIGAKILKIVDAGSSGVKVEDVKCQAYADEQGKVTLGGVFTNKKEEFFTDDIQGRAIGGIRCGV